MGAWTGVPFKPHDLWYLLQKAGFRGSSCNVQFAVHRLQHTHVFSSVPLRLGRKDELRSPIFEDNLETPSSGRRQQGQPRNLLLLQRLIDPRDSCKVEHPRTRLRRSGLVPLDPALPHLRRVLLPADRLQEIGLLGYRKMEIVRDLFLRDQERWRLKAGRWVAHDVGGDVLDHPPLDQLGEHPWVPVDEDAQPVEFVVAVLEGKGGEHPRGAGPNPLYGKGDMRHVGYGVDSLDSLP